MTRQLLGILGTRLPIVQGGMLWLATAELAAAVSNAGGLGTISPYGGMAADGDPLLHLEQQITRAREMTAQPFAVNVLLDLPLAGVLLSRAAERNVAVVVTAAGDPHEYTPLLKSLGIVVLHVVTSTDQARRAEKAGVDAVIVQGSEAGGRHGPRSSPLSSLVPQVVDAVSVPVVAAGGIVDSRGVLTTLALGAAGVQLGTRFLASAECPAHPAYKQAILVAGAGETLLTGPPSPARCLDTPFTRRIEGLRRAGAPESELRAARPFRGTRDAQLDGKFDQGELYCGASAELICEVLPAGQIVEQLRDGMREASL